MGGGVIEWSLRASGVIFIVLLLRQGLKGRIKKSWQYALWLVVLVRLLVPQLPASSLSVFNLMDFLENGGINRTVQEELFENGQDENFYKGSRLEEGQEVQIQVDGLQENDRIKNQRVSLNNSFKITKGPMEQLNGIIMGIWFIGCTGLSLYYLYGYYRVKKKLAKLEVVQEEGLKQSFIKCKEKLGIQKEMTLVYHSTPMIFGVLNPIVTIPKGYDMKEQEMMVLHELIHYKYKDNIMTYVQLVAQIFHWFNPFVWFAMSLMKEDMELACDERMLLLGTSKKDYAHTLVKVMSCTKLETCFTQGMGDASKQIKNRILHITMFKRPKLWTSVVAAIIGILLIGGCLTNPHTTQNPKVEQNSTNSEGIGTLIESKYKEQGVKNIVLLGMDASHLRADSIMVVSLNNITGETTVVSIPRDTQVIWDSDQKALLSSQGVNPPEHTKISQMFVYGKKEDIRKLLLKEIEELLTIKVDHYVLIDFKAAEDFIDALGGIEVEVPQDMYYEDKSQDLRIDLKEGYQLLTGEKTLQLMRYRMYPEGDLQRIKLGQEVIKAILEKMLDPSHLTQLSHRAESLLQTVVTDITIDQLGSCLDVLKKIDSNQIHSFILPGQGEYRDGTSFFVVDEEGREALIKRIN